MKNASYVFFILISGILQLSLLDHLRFFGVKPDLLLACVIVVSLSCPARWAVGLSLFAGIFKDIFSAGNFGINTLLFPFWSVVIINLNRKIRIENNYLRMGIVFIVVFFHGLLSGLTPAYTDKPIAAAQLARIISFTSLYTALTLPLLFKIDEFRQGGFFCRCRVFVLAFAGDLGTKLRLHSGSRKPQA